MPALNTFIQDELDKRRRDYSDSPAYILEHYNKEQQNIQAYNGRQLFEMLQNADDEAETANNPKVVIKLKGNELTIANNGQPFTQEGFRSIIYSDLSHKPMQQNKIGQKGLGFRSILSWADEVVISSGGARIGFSEKYAKAFLKDLIKISSHITSFLKMNNKTDLPIATLRIPQILPKAQKSRNKFDTVISIKLKNNVLPDVQSQITNIISKETLLFLNNLKIIEIDSPETKITFTKTINDNNTITVKSKNLITSKSESKTWSIKKVSGTYKEKNYELAIAWSEKLDDEENVLYSFFKTQVRFPFPALLHGTFELTSDRNRLERDTFGHNQFLTEKLADLLIKTALEIASKDSKATYLPLKLLNIDFDKVDIVLSSFNLKQTLEEKIKSSKIFPNVNGEYISYASKPVYYDYPVAEILKGTDVRNLMPICDDESLVKFFKTLPIFYYVLDSYISKISRRLKNISYAEIANLIYHLFTYHLYKEELRSSNFNLSKLSPFLPDTEGNRISWNSNVFLPSQNKINFRLPKSLKVRFVNSELVEHLLEEFNSYELFQKFEQLSVKKYSFLDIAATLINHYKEKENLKLVDVKELHFYLFRLFKNEKEKPANLPNSIETPVISLKRGIKKANEIYFGKHYSNELAEQLYCFDKSKILASTKAFGLENENEKIVGEYFKWLGVEELPRYFIVSTENWQYKEHILRNLDFRRPIDSNYSDYYRTYNHLQTHLNRGGKISIGHFDDLKNILTKSNTEFIFEWINKDERLRRTLAENKEILVGAQAAIDIEGKRNYRFVRNQNLRSYTRWLFANTSWLPVDSEAKIAEPDKCCLSKTITKEFSPFVEKPKIDIASLADRLELPEDTIETYLVNAGVHREISDFSTTRLYEMLLSLPDSDKEGNVAKTIYREIIKNFDENKLDINNPSYKEFLETGRVLCQKGSEIDYFKVGEAFYIDTKTFGRNVLKRFPLVTIDRKSGSQKVKRLFGANQLENIKFNLLSEPEEHPLQNIFHEEIERFKGLVYALRIHQDTRHLIRNRLKLLRIILSPSIETEFIHNEEIEPFKLEQYEFITHKNKTTFYILVAKNIDSINELKSKIDFKESIAEIFTTLLNTEEHRSFIRELYSTPEIDRETLLMNEIQQDSNEILVESKKQLNIIDDIRLSFWRAFSISSKQKTEINSEKDLISYSRDKLKLTGDVSQKLLSLDTYSDISEMEIQELLYKLFLDFKVNYDNFSRHFSELNFADFFKNKFDDIRAMYRSEFSNHLYKKLKDEPIIEKKQFFQKIDEYDYLTFDDRDGFHKDIEKYFLKKIEYIFAVFLKNKLTIFSSDKVINDNKKSIIERGINIPETLMELRSVQALLLFNEVDELEKMVFENNNNANLQNLNINSNQINFRGKSINFDDYESLKQQVLEGIDFSRLKLKRSKTIRIEDLEKKGKKRRKPSNRRKVKFSKKNEEQVGYISELLSYQLLCLNYPNAKINWISENAFRANVDVTAEAGKGYDLELIENDKIRYIEVKGISDIDDGIKMSTGEINKALEFPDKYDLLIVENPLGEKPIFRYIKSPFKLKKGELFISNSKFRVFNENYIIKFDWDE